MDTAPAATDQPATPLAKNGEVDHFLTDDQHVDLLIGVLSILRSTRSLFWSGYGTIGHAELTADGTDLALHHQLAEQLQSSLPHSGLWTENTEPVAGQHTWVICPIAGVANYLKGQPHCATLIGLLDPDDRPILGVVSAPAINSTWYAIEGHGAFCNGRQIHSSHTEDLTRARISHGNLTRAHRLGVSGAFGAVAQRVAHSQSLEPFYGFMSVAEGVIDAAFEWAMEPWETLPLLPILTEAGAAVHHLRRPPAPEGLIAGGIRIGPDVTRILSLRA